MESHLRVTWACLVLASFGSACVARAEQEEGRHYNLLFSAEREVLSLEFFGGSSGVRVIYRVFGDGRLSREKVDPVQGTSPISVQSADIQRSDVEDLIHDLARAGVLEIASEALEARRRSSAPIAHAPEDGSAMVLRVVLDSFQVGENEPIAPFETSLAVASPSWLARTYPESAEYQALLRAQLQLQTAFRPRRG